MHAGINSLTLSKSSMGARVHRSPRAQHDTCTRRAASTAVLTQTSRVASQKHTKRIVWLESESGLVGNQLEVGNASTTTASSTASSAVLTRDELAWIEASFQSSPREDVLKGVNFGVAESSGPRPYMEDRHQVLPTLPPIHTGIQLTTPALHLPIDSSYAAVFDGHSGIDAAEMAAARLHVHLVATPALRNFLGGGLTFVSDETNERVVGRALRKAFQQTDEEILTSCRVQPGTRCSGSTALVTLRLGSHLFVANAGDCRAVLCRDGRPVRLTRAHHPELVSERQRIEREGGNLQFSNGWRVVMDDRDGLPKRGVRVSRGLGDLHFKEPVRLIESEPDVLRTELEPEDSFVILGSDGVWSTVGDAMAVDIVRQVLQQEALAGATADEAAHAAAKKLLYRSLDRGCMDNATVVVMVMDWGNGREGKGNGVGNGGANGAVNGRVNGNGRQRESVLVGKSAEDKLWDI